MTEQVPVRWLKPKNDFIFSLIFGSDNAHSKELLLAFLNDVLNVPRQKPLVSVGILNPISTQQDILDKNVILDIKAKADGYGYVNVEIQLANQKNMHKRSLYYGAKLYEEQLNKGEDYKELTRVVAINLMDFEFFPSDGYYSCYRLIEEYTHEPYPDLMQLHFLEFPKFRRQDKMGHIKWYDRMAKWLQFLTNEDDSR